MSSFQHFTLEHNTYNHKFKIYGPQCNLAKGRHLNIRNGDPKYLTSHGLSDFIQLSQNSSA